MARLLAFNAVCKIEDDFAKPMLRLIISHRIWSWTRQLARSLGLRGDKLPLTGALVSMASLSSPFVCASALKTGPEGQRDQMLSHP